jgi:tyrosine-protein phosphatase SIW14
MTPLNIPGIENGWKVDASIWRGAQPSDAAWPLLAAAGAKSVLDLNNSDPQELGRQSELVSATGMRYATYPLDNLRVATQLQVENALTELDYLEKPVFVHCAQGSDRSGVICACWRIHHEHWTLEEAIDEAFTGLGFNGMHEFWMSTAVAEYARSVRRAA